MRVRSEVPGDRSSSSSEERGGKVGGRQGRVGVREHGKVRVGARSGSVAGMGSRGVIEVRCGGEKREGKTRAGVARAGTPTP